MKLLLIGENSLIKLPYFYKTVFSNFGFISSIYARQLAAATPTNHNVKVLMNYEEIKYEEKCDAVLIHFRTGTAMQAYAVADKYRKKGTKVILSGPHPTALPEEAQKHGDCVLIGNTETLWDQVLKDLENKNLKKTYKSKPANTLGSFGKSLTTDQSSMIITGVIEATRGCPYKCDFCQDSNIFHGSIFRTRPVEDVISEIKSFPQKLLFFCDVSLTVDPEYTKTLFRSMKGLKKKFICEGNADVLARDEELLQLSYEAGCYEWTVGFESFSQETLKNVNKKTNEIQDFLDVTKKVQKHRMAVLGNFMFGFNNDTPDVFNTTLKKIKELGLNSARFAILTPYPGTPLFKEFEKEGRILTHDWSKYNRKTVVFQPKSMTVKELQNGFLEISQKFNNAPNAIYRSLRGLKLGFYPFLNCTGRNIENYLNRPNKWAR